VAGEEGGFVWQVEVERIYQVDRRALSRIVAAAKDVDGVGGDLRDAEARGGGLGQGGGRVVERELDFGEAEHGGAGSAADTQAGGMIFARLIRERKFNHES
jgi:hypothetical protein